MGATSSLKNAPAWACELLRTERVGRTEIVDAGGRDDVLGALAERYRQHRERRPCGPLLRLTPSRVIYWRAEPGNLR